jgi:hypothetical protein
MPVTHLFFLHGVASRSDKPSYAASVLNRDALFKSVAFSGKPCTISNPIWGDDAQKWAWDEQSLPTKSIRNTVESFSLSEGLGVAPASHGGSALAAMATVDTAAAIDTLFAAAVERANKQGRPLTPEEISDFAKATRFFGGNSPQEQEPLIPNVPMPDDAALVRHVRTTIDAAGSFGFADYLRDAAVGVFESSRNLLSTGLVDTFRDTLNPAVGRFLGDIFVYLKNNAQRTKIRSDVLTPLANAWQLATAAHEPLILVGHSLGGVILYDMLSNPVAAGLPAGFKADLLVTVGSQVGVFEEFKVYDSSSEAFGSSKGNKVPKLATTAAWINVFDPVDILSFRCTPIFEGVTDYMFSSGTGLLSAHTAYFGRPRFYARLRARLQQLQVL